MMNRDNYNKFIEEQKTYFEQHLYKPSEPTWDEPHWLKYGIGSSWLLSRGKGNLNFTSLINTKGLPNLDISKEYQEFCKAMLIYSYRQANGIASESKLRAELIILKRWYYSLYTVLDNTSPLWLSTEILNHAYDILKQNCNYNKLPDHVGTFKRLQSVINRYSFTKRKLEFSIQLEYNEKHNLTPKARKTKELLEKESIDENQLDSEKLITTQTFINIASLKNLCKDNGERILLNFLYLAIITGFRATEIILLKIDCLIERPLLDPVTNKPQILNGKPQYSLGIQYYGAKGAGRRIHWVEPSTILLVKTIVQEILELTQDYREHLSYIRQKKLKDFLPKAIDEIPHDLLELDEFIDNIFIIGKNSVANGRARKRDSAFKTLGHYNIHPTKIVQEKQGKLKYYSKASINDYIKSIANYDKQDPITYRFKFDNEIVSLPLEKLLFIIPFGANKILETLVYKTNIVLLDNIVIGKFLGFRRKTMSIFEKYQLKDEDGQSSKLSSHIPRHNINTFLAIAEISEHLQAMLMGRVDIKQNAYYQHLSINQTSQNTSLSKKIQQVNNSPKKELISKNLNTKEDFAIKSPIDAILEHGLMLFSGEKDLGNNLKNNLHTFDNRNEIASYIIQSPKDDFFDDITRAFRELADTTPETAKELVETHAYLYPLPFGSCMRNIATQGCPKRMACQSGVSCVNFTVTGRMGELENLVSKKELLFQQIAKLDEKNDFTIKLNEQIHTLATFEKKLIVFNQTRLPVKIFDTIDTELSQPKILAQLFSIEYDKIKANEDKTNA